MNDQVKTTEKTNDYLSEVIKDVDVLITWAAADADHAADNDAWETMAEDRVRLAYLELARQLLIDCKR